MSGELDKDGKLELNYKGLQKISFPNMLRYAGKDKDFILLGDFHPEASIMRNAFSKDSIATMKEIGVKHLAVELSKDDQYIFDGFASGKYSLDQVKQVFSNSNISGLKGEDLSYMRQRIPEMMQEAKEAGIKIHCVDLPRNDPRRLGHGPDDQMNTLIDEFRRKGLNPGQLEDYLLQREQTDPGIKARFQENFNAGLALRFTHDKDIADELRPLASDGKVAVLYGVDHFTKEQDINEYLGKDRSTVIGMFDNEAGERSSVNKEYDAPDYIFYDKLSADKPFSAGGKLEPEGKYSAACELVVKQLKAGLSVNSILACATPDKDFNDFASTRLQTPASAAPSRTVGGPP
ncbi:MAG: hypothetical protein K2X09_04585 [Rickettsiales bacterium]|nr:hypothetical protein [Rickettsiales bacterium]